MDLPQLLEIFGAVSVAMLFGSMTFFSCVLAPLIFIELDAATAGRFIRRLFPWYYVVIGILSLIAALSFAVTLPYDAAIMGIITFGAYFSRQVVMPRTNLWRDAMMQGNKASEVSFKQLHRIFVLINAVQLPYFASYYEFYGNSVTQIMKTLPFRVKTGTGDIFDIEFPLHEETGDPVRVSQMVRQLLATLDRDLALFADTSNGDVL